MYSDEDPPKEGVDAEARSVIAFDSSAGTPAWETAGGDPDYGLRGNPVHAGDIRVRVGGWMLTKDALRIQLRELRELRGMSQKSLGARIGLVGAQISQIESGKYVPSLEVLNDILEVLDAELVIQLKEDQDDPRRSSRAAS